MSHKTRDAMKSTKAQRKAGFKARPVDESQHRSAERSRGPSSKIVRKIGRRGK